MHISAVLVCIQQGAELLYSNIRTQVISKFKDVYLDFILNFVKWGNNQILLTSRIDTKYSNVACEQEKHIRHSLIPEIYVS